MYSAAGNIWYFIIKSKILQTFVIKKKLLHKKASGAKIMQILKKNTWTFVMGQKLIVYWKAKKNAILIQTVMVLCFPVELVHRGDNITREWKYARQKHWLQSQQKTGVFISIAMKVNFEFLKRAPLISQLNQKFWQK